MKYGEMYPLSNWRPSVNSSSRPIVGDSSTVITPSLPTLANASAISSPMFASCAEIVATCAISVCSSTSRASLSSCSEIAAAAASIPRFMSIGLAPAATERKPWCTIAWARTVAVVVPSPAMSLVLVATSLASWAPRFSYGFSSSTSLATVTPSLVMVGAPHFLSSTTLRPRGPSVTFTTSASLLTPRSSERRASSSNSRILGIDYLNLRLDRVLMSRWGRTDVLPHEPQTCLLLDDGEHVARGEYEVLLARVLDLGAAILAVEDHVADLYVDRHALGSRVVKASRAHRKDLALLGLLLGGVRDHQSGRRGLLSLERTDHNPVFERLDYYFGGGRHDLTSPSGKANGELLERANVVVCRRGDQTTSSH